MRAHITIESIKEIQKKEKWFLAQQTRRYKKKSQTENKCRIDLLRAFDSSLSKFLHFSYIYIRIKDRSEKLMMFGEMTISIKNHIKNSSRERRKLGRKNAFLFFFFSLLIRNQHYLFSPSIYYILQHLIYYLQMMFFLYKN